MKLLWFCAAGYSFFVGSGLIIIAIVLSAFHKKLWLNIVIYLLFINGLFLIFLSSTPLTFWFYIIWSIAIICWLYLVVQKTPRVLKHSIILRIIAAFLSVTAMVTELRFQLTPNFPKEKFEKLYVIGDSVSAGIGGINEETWPKIICNEHEINIINLSESSATVTSAMRQANQVDSENAIVLLEIGGNDLFAPTPYSKFEEDLERLIKKTSGPKRMVIMLELPLQPWHIKYGRIQRKLAKQHDIILIPKRFFVSILSTKDATVDLAHLSPSGHKLMAEKVWNLLKNSLFATEF